MDCQGYQAVTVTCGLTELGGQLRQVGWRAPARATEHSPERSKRPGNTQSQVLQEQGELVRGTETAPGPKVLTSQVPRGRFQKVW